MSEDKVSVIVPVYNAEKYLNMCIHSIQEQTHANWELLLINDGSTDGSETICRSFAKADERIRLISQKNQGVSAARNAGLAHAAGDYITFVDSDDELEKDALEVLLKDIKQHRADIASATKDAVWPDGRRQSLHNDGTVSICEDDEMVKRSLQYDDFTRSLHAKLFTRELLCNVRFAEGHNINEDGYFMFECYVKKPKVVQHNVCLYGYHHWENTASRGRFTDKYLDMLYFGEMKMQYIQEHMPQFMDEAKDMVVRTNLLFLQVLCRSRDKKYREVQKQCVQTVRALHGYHRPINSHMKRLERIVRFGLYPLYKRIYRMKFGW